MSSIYNNAGQTKSTHIHKLQRIDDPTYRYRCVECWESFQRLSGILISGKQPQHGWTECKITKQWYSKTTTGHGPGWMQESTCPECGRVGKYISNFLGRRKIYCNGLKFEKALTTPRA